jgi:signal transduction histidine kinase/CheY-like chemotaxis protein
MGLCLSRRINHPDGSFAGVAVVGLPIDYILSLFRDIELGHYGALNLLNDKGILIARWPYSAQDVGRDLSGSQMFQILAKAPAGKFEATGSIDGKARLYFYRRVGTLPLIIGAGLSRREIYADWVRKTAIVGTVLVTLCLLGMMLALLLRRELIRRGQAEESARRAAAKAEDLARDLARAIAPIDTLFKNSVDTMQVIYKNADGEFVYEVVNPTWQNLVGVPNNAAVGRRPQDCLPPAVAEKVFNSWLTCAQERRPVRLGLEFPPQSERQWDIVVLPIIGDDDDVTRLVVVGRDVTEQNRLAAAELQQAQKIEVMGQLAAGTSHDFNNILQVIGGGIEIIRDDPSISQDALELLEMVQRATRRGASLTRHLLDYARKQMWHAEFLNFAEIVENLRQILSRTLGTHIAVTIDVAPEIGLIRADRSQLETALMNLAINAAHAMPNGGTLHFEVARAPADQPGPIEGGRMLVIAVTDSGTGMAPDLLERIFDPFFTTKGAAGNGLGLAMVQRFARQAGGDVRVTSALGAGSRFEIWLPEFDEPAPRALAAGDVLVGGAGGTVLLVDDAEDVLIVVAAFLRTGGFMVHQASSGQQALWTMVAGTHFDVLITDHMMPSMKGGELIHRVREVQPELPALVISGFADAVDHLTDLPDIMVLTKPFQREELVAMVNQLIATERTRRDRDPRAAPASVGSATLGAGFNHPLARNTT